MFDSPSPNKITSDVVDVLKICKVKLKLTRYVMGAGLAQAV
jgi:hypothetical protein